MSRILNKPTGSTESWSMGIYVMLPCFQGICRRILIQNSPIANWAAEMHFQPISLPLPGLRGIFTELILILLIS